MRHIHFSHDCFTIFLIWYLKCLVVPIALSRRFELLWRGGKRTWDSQVHILHSPEKRFQISNCQTKLDLWAKSFGDIKLQRSLPRRVRVIRLLVDVDFCFVRLRNGMPLVYCGFLPNSRFICVKKQHYFRARFCVWTFWFWNRTHSLWWFVFQLWNAASSRTRPSCPHPFLWPMKSLSNTLGLEFLMVADIKRPFHVMEIKVLLSKCSSVFLFFFFRCVQS